MRGIDKHFPGVTALDGVDFDVRAGEVHALMGQNGAGKSTLIKVLTGVYDRDGGEVFFQGRPFRSTSVADAQARGISTIYQEVNLVPTLSVAENLFLGRMPCRWFGLDWAELRRRSRELLARFDLHIDVDADLGSYSVAVQQMVSIARAVDIDARLIIMDEPTSSLDQHETNVLFELMASLKSRGLGIVFITHFLEQVYRVSDRITVLRNGRKVGTFPAGQLSPLELVGHMVGTTAEQARRLQDRSGRAVQAPPDAPVVLEAWQVGRRGAIQPFNLDLRKGEVLALAGLLGSGRTEAARLLFGADRAESGEILLSGKPVRTKSLFRLLCGFAIYVAMTTLGAILLSLSLHGPADAPPLALLGFISPVAGLAVLAYSMSEYARDKGRSGLLGLLGFLGIFGFILLLCFRDYPSITFGPRQAIAHGIAFCPEDRKADGLFLDMSVLDNIVLVVQRRLSRLGLTSARLHRQIASEFVARLDIKTPDLARPVRHLSGGNQQKVILARWLASRPLVLILDEPTRGIDVAAKAEIERLVDELANSGLGIVFISAELDEVVRRATRLLVLRDRRVIGELTGQQIRTHEVMNLIAGEGPA